MAGKLTAPNPAMFDPDALEQIYAKGTIGGDPSTSGLAYAFLKNQQGNRQDAGAAYIKQLQQVNAMQSLLDQLGMHTDLMKTVIPQGVEAMKEGGFQLSDFPEVWKIMTGGDPTGAAASRAGMAPELMRARINKMNADAMSARSQGGPQETVKLYGPAADLTIKGQKGGKPLTSEELRRRHDELTKGAPSIVDPEARRRMMMNRDSGRE